MHVPSQPHMQPSPASLTDTVYITPSGQTLFTTVLATQRAAQEKASLRPGFQEQGFSLSTLLVALCPFTVVGLVWLSPIFLPLGSEPCSGAADSPPEGVEGMRGAGKVAWG